MLWDVLGSYRKRLSSHLFTVPSPCKMMCPFWIDATYTCSLTLGDCSRACRASKDFSIVCVKLIKAVLPVTETSSNMRCNADQNTETLYWVECSMLAFSYTKRGINLCRHVPQRYLSWRMIRVTSAVC